MGGRYHSPMKLWMPGSAEPIRRFTAPKTGTATKRFFDADSTEVVRWRALPA